MPPLNAFPFALILPGIYLEFCAVMFLSFKRGEKYASVFVCSVALLGSRIYTWNRRVTPFLFVFLILSLHAIPELSLK